MEWILGIDQGTTGTTALGVSVSGEILARVTIPVGIQTPQPGWVQQDAQALWGSVLRSIRGVLSQIPTPPMAIGLTNQRETVVVWDRDGNPVAPAIVWQCRRSASLCGAHARWGEEPLIRQRTGLTLDPYFSATKLEWLAQEGLSWTGLRWGTVDSWVLYNLSGGEVHATDPSNASRTMLYTLGKGWDAELAALFGIPEHTFPEIRPSAGPFGVTKGLGILPDGIPISAVLGDQQAALFGQGCLEKGMAKSTYGTGCFLLLQAGQEIPQPPPGILATVAWQVEEIFWYALEGSIFNAGAVVQWLRDLGLLGEISQVEALAQEVPDTAGVILVPAFSGLGAPYWDSQARGTIFGLTRGTTRSHLARAALESIAFQAADLFESMSRLGLPIARVRADGGAAANDLLMQIQADLLGIPVDRALFLETTALGVARMAGLSQGVLTWEECARPMGERSFQPSLDPKGAKTRKDRWQQAVAACRSLPY